MQLLKYITIIPVLALCVSCSAQSQDSRPPKGKKGGPPSFKQLLADLDSNKDGKLAQAEVKGPLKEDFAKIDKDMDGFITEEELKKMGPPKGPRKKN